MFVVCLVEEYVLAIVHVDECWCGGGGAVVVVVVVGDEIRLKDAVGLNSMFAA